MTVDEVRRHAQTGQYMPSVGIVGRSEQMQAPDYRFSKICPRYGARNITNNEGKNCDGQFRLGGNGSSPILIYEDSWTRLVTLTVNIVLRLLWIHHGHLRHVTGTDKRMNWQQLAKVYVYTEYSVLSLAKSASDICLRFNYPGPWIWVSSPFRCAGSRCEKVNHCTVQHSASAL